MANERRPWCFGNAERVCPRDDKGFIEPQEKCLQCALVKACLQQALKASGALPTPILETPAVTRVSRFLKRWSDQKLASCRKDCGAEPE